MLPGRDTPIPGQITRLLNTVNNFTSDAIDLRWTEDDAAWIRRYNLRAARLAANDNLDQLAALPPKLAAALLQQAGIKGVHTLEEARRRLASAPLVYFDHSDPQTIEDRIAEALARFNAVKHIVSDDDLRLLTADDATLLAEAERIADAQMAMHQALIAKNEEGIHPRERDARTIRRRLRRRVGRAGIHLAAALKLIGGPKQSRLPAYVDNWAMARWQSSQEANTAYKANRELHHPTLGTVSLLEASASSDKARENRWYTVLLGIQQVAERRGWVPLFLTFTLPPEYHLHPRSGDTSRADISLSPRDSVIEINARWHRLLSMLHRRGVNPVGVRIIEPHSDACGHLHCCVWLPPERLTDVYAAVDRHFPATTDDERLARRAGDYTEGPAAIVKEWHRDDATSPVSYVLTYVFKTLQAKNAPKDNESGGGHDRAAAWAAAIGGVRRISLVGLRSGTMARLTAVQRTAKYAEDGRIDEPRCRAIAHAITRRRWGQALLLVGAFADVPRLIPIREQRQNCWGDDVSYTTGYAHSQTGECGALVKPVTWTLREISTSDADDAEKDGGSVSGSVSGATDDVSVVMCSPRQDADAPCLPETEADRAWQRFIAEAPHALDPGPEQDIGAPPMAMTQEEHAEWWAKRYDKAA